MFREEAKELVLGTTGELQDIDVTYNIASLHRIQGTIVSAEDHHLISTGFISLRSQSHKEFLRSARVDASGLFSLDFVPPGPYSLSLTSIMDANMDKTTTVGVLTFATEVAEQRYLPTEQAITVDRGDLFLAPIEVKVARKRTTAAK